MKNRSIIFLVSTCLYMAFSTSYALTLMQKPGVGIGCHATTDLCVSVEPVNHEIHDVLLRVDANAIIDGQIIHEEKELQWEFWHAGRYWVGIKNAYVNLEYLHLVVMEANGKPLNNSEACQFDFQLHAVGNYGIRIQKQEDGSIVCLKS